MRYEVNDQKISFNRHFQQNAIRGFQKHTTKFAPTFGNVNKQFQTPEGMQKPMVYVNKCCTSM